MTKSQKITLASTRDIPFNKLVLSQANVRTIKTGVSIEELAEDIARRGLLQSLYVRPVMRPVALTPALALISSWCMAV
jgi:ParB family transcriptional regulator, chromosome partitioning protein